MRHATNESCGSLCPLDLITSTATNTAGAPQDRLGLSSSSEPSFSITLKLPGKSCFRTRPPPLSSLSPPESPHPAADQQLKSLFLASIENVTQDYLDLRDKIASRFGLSLPAVLLPSYP